MLLAAFAIFNLPIHFLLGWIADFANKPKLVTICLFLGVVAVLPMLWSNSLWALWFFTCLYSVLDASIPVFWASVGAFFGRKSFGSIRGNMNLFYTGEPFSAHTPPAPSTIRLRATPSYSASSPSPC